MNEILKKLPNDKIKINWNKNPIKMDQFISFLTVGLTRSKKHLGSDTGWTKLYGENNLEISGGIVNGVEYLDSIKYKKNLHNGYNNFVSPFYLFEIMTDEGKDFFVEYYSDDIEKEIKIACNGLDRAKKYKDEVFECFGSIGVSFPE